MSILQTVSADAGFLTRVAAAADQFVAGLVETDDGGAQVLAHRPAMGRLLALLAVYTEPRSAHYQQEHLVAEMSACLARLELLQGPTGLFDGTNLCSPPDSAFTLNDVCLALGLIRHRGEKAEPLPAGQQRADPSQADPVLAGVAQRLDGIISRATDAMVAGGVHTPNHRWELCAALAQMNVLQPRPDIDPRIAEWLAEGIDLLPDGMYSERSPLYATAVTNPSLLAIADSSDRPELLDHVRRNLRAFLPWFNRDGTVESVFSRRQDQWMAFQASPFLHLYRRLASQDGDTDFAAAATWLEQFPLYEPAKLLALTRLDPWLGAALPEAAPSDAGLPLPLVPAAAALDSCGVFRFRKSGAVTTVFGGCDDQVPGVVSGLATNPTFLRFAAGAAVLTDVRLSRSFFDLGPFRSQQTVRAGSSVTLTEELAANFYLPLPASKRRADGIYALEHEGRFSASMDFSSRPTVTHRLATTICVTVDGAETALDVGFEGAETAFAMELTFQPGGVLEGVEPAGEADSYQLVAGRGRYRVGADVIEFGPGAAADPDTPAAYNPGESYLYLAGTNASAGVKVFITGRTTGNIRFTLRAASS